MYVDVLSIYLVFIAILMIVSYLQILFLSRQKHWILKKKLFYKKRREFIQKEYLFLKKYLLKSFLLVGLYFLLGEKASYIEINFDVLKFVILISSVNVLIAYMFFEILWKIMQERLERKSQKSIRESLDTSFINDCKYKINLYFSDFQVPVRAVYLFEKIYIYVDKKFYYKFSTKELELIILHEVGHFKVSKFKKYLSLYLFSTLLCASVVVQYTYHGFTIGLVMSIEMVLFLIYFFYNYLNRKDEYFADRYANTNKRNYDVNMIDVLKKGYKVYKKFPYQYSLHNKLWSKHPTLMQRIISMQ